MECGCEEAEEIMYQGQYLCSKCFTSTGPVISEEYITRKDKPKSRQMKFHTMLNNIEGLPWFVRYTLLDCFSKIEHHFFTSERINFINMNQLAIELCKKCGYSEYCSLFKPLKTKSRVNQVTSFINTAMAPRVAESKPAGACRLDAMEFIMPKVEGPLDLTRVYYNPHTYSG